MTIEGATVLGVTTPDHIEIYHVNAGNDGKVTWIANVMCGAIETVRGPYYGDTPQEALSALLSAINTEYNEELGIKIIRYEGEGKPGEKVGFKPDHQLNTPDGKSTS